MGFVTHPQPWSASLSTSSTTSFVAALYTDSLPDLSFFFVASASFWFFTGSWSEGVTNNATAGASGGRGSLLAAGGYNWVVPEDAVLNFRDAGSNCTLNGVVSAAQGGF